MKANKTRELLDELDCQACGYAKEMLEKGFCCHSCEDHYRLEDEIEVELTELERLAEMGKIVEALFDNKVNLLVNPEWCHGELESYDNSIKSIKDLISWYREQQSDAI